jgi:hypothetical protein
MVRAQLKSWSKALHRKTYLRNVALANQSRHCSVSPLQLVHRLRCIVDGRLVAVLRTIKSARSSVRRTFELTASRAGTHEEDLFGRVAELKAQHVPLERYPAQRVLDELHIAQDALVLEDPPAECRRARDEDEAVGVLRRRRGLEMHLDLGCDGWYNLVRTYEIDKSKGLETKAVPAISFIHRILGRHIQTMLRTAGSTTSGPGSSQWIFSTA